MKIFNDNKVTGISNDLIENCKLEYGSQLIEVERECTVRCTKVTSMLVTFVKYYSSVYEDQGR